MNEELKPCPFCGGEAFLNENVVTIHCPPCCGKGVMASVTVGRKLGGSNMKECIDKAISLWNRRQEAKPLTESVIMDLITDHVFSTHWGVSGLVEATKAIHAALPPDQSTRIAELEGLLATERSQSLGFEKLYHREQEITTKLQSQRDRLRQALGFYGHHKARCACINNAKAACSCGLIREIEGGQP